MRAGIVGDDLRFSGAGEIGEAGIRNFDRLDARCRPRRAPSATLYAEDRGGRSRRMRKANSGSATRISFPAMAAMPPSGMTVSGRMRPAIGPRTLMCSGRPRWLLRSSSRTIVRRTALRSGPGSRNLRSVLRAQLRFEPGELGAGAPMLAQDTRGGFYLRGVEHRAMTSCVIVAIGRKERHPLADHDPGVRPEVFQQPQHRRPRHGDTTRRWAEVFAREMQATPRCHALRFAGRCCDRSR